MAEHNSNFSTGQILGVLTDMSACVIEFLKSGYSVDLGLARFYLTLTSTGVGNVDDFATSLIKKVNIRTAVSKETVSAINNSPEFEFVLTREAEALAKKQAKESLPNFTSQDDSGDDNGGNSGGEITE